VLILPGVKKFGFGVGGSGGRGPLLCRSAQDFDGKWSAPAMYSADGASIGAQVGGSSSDFVLLLMNPNVVNQVLNGKTKMGTDATAAAGPGATAASASDAHILTYGRAQGSVPWRIPGRRNGGTRQWRELPPVQRDADRNRYRARNRCRAIG